MLIDSTDVAIDADVPTLILVGFESERRGSRHYLILQRSREFDQQDIELGLDAIYIERDDQRHSSFGGITRFELRRDRVRIRLDGVTAEKLGGEAEIEVRFGVDNDQFERLRAALAEVFHGYDTFVDLAA